MEPTPEHPHSSIDVTTAPERFSLVRRAALFLVGHSVFLAAAAWLFYIV